MSNLSIFPVRRLEFAFLFLVLAFPHHAWAFARDLSSEGRWIALYAPLLLGGTLCGALLGGLSRTLPLEKTSFRKLLRPMLTCLEAAFVVVALAVSVRCLLGAFVGREVGSDRVYYFDLIFSVGACVLTAFSLFARGGERCGEKRDETAGTSTCELLPSHLALTIAVAALFTFGWMFLCIDGWLVDEVGVAVTWVAQVLAAFCACAFMASSLAQNRLVLVSAISGVFFAYYLADAACIYRVVPLAVRFAPFALCAFCVHALWRSLRHGEWPLRSLAWIKAEEDDQKQSLDFASLTEKERTTVGLSLEGLSSAEIAERLGVKPSTVRGNLQRAYKKLGVANLAGLHSRFDKKTPSTIDSEACKETPAPGFSPCSFVVLCVAVLSSITGLFFFYQLSPFSLGALPDAQMSVGMALGAAFAALVWRAEAAKARVPAKTICTIVYVAATAYLVWYGLQINYHQTWGWQSYHMVFTFVASVGLSALLAYAFLLALNGFQNAGVLEIKKLVSGLLVVSVVLFVGSLHVVLWAACVVLLSAILLVAVAFLGKQQRPAAVQHDSTRPMDLQCLAALLASFVVGLICADVWHYPSIFVTRIVTVPFMVMLGVALFVWTFASFQYVRERIALLAASVLPFFGTMLSRPIPSVNGDAFIVNGESPLFVVLYVSAIVLIMPSLNEDCPNGRMARCVILCFSIGVVANRFCFASSSIEGMIFDDEAMDWYYRSVELFDALCTLFFGGTSFVAFFLLAYCVRNEINRRGSRACGTDDSNRAVYYLMSRGLNETEAKILVAVAAGLSGSEVARRLSYSIGTVNSARNRGYRVLGIHSSAELKLLIQDNVSADKSASQPSHPIS